MIRPGIQKTIELFPERKTLIQVHSLQGEANNNKLTYYGASQGAFNSRYNNHSLQIFQILKTQKLLIAIQIYRETQGQQYQLCANMEDKDCNTNYALIWRTASSNAEQICELVLYGKSLDSQIRA